jgi:cyanophycinase
MKIHGKLIIIGGAVDKGSFTERDLDQNAPNNLNFFEEGILKRIIKESKYKEQSRIEVITTASSIPREIGPEYVKAFSHLKATNVGVLYIEKREQASEPEVIERIKNADIVMFTGGDQLRLTSILGGTEMHTIILNKYKNEDFIYAELQLVQLQLLTNMIYQGSSRKLC